MEEMRLKKTIETSVAEKESLISQLTSMRDQAVTSPNTI